MVVAHHRLRETRSPPALAGRDWRCDGSGQRVQLDGAGWSTGGGAACVSLDAPIRAELRGGGLT